MSEIDLKFMQRDARVQKIIGTGWEERYNINLREFESIIKNNSNALSLEHEQQLEDKRNEFIKAFPMDKLHSITLDEYALGTDSAKESFCYWIETILKELGDIHGAPSFKFGVYYGVRGEDKEQKWRWNKWTNNDFEVVKNELCALLEAGASDNYSLILKNHLSPTFKGKILAMYYPDRYLNIYSEKHVNYFLRKAFNDYSKQDLETAKQKLLDYKNYHPLMANWSNLRFTYFLYQAFFDVNEIKVDDDEETVSFDSKQLFPIETKNTYESLQRKKSSKRNKINTKPDYEQLARLNATIGKTGEEAVVLFERNRLKDVGRIDLADKVEWVSLRSDSFGYDVSSFNVDGSPKHIEVKTSSNSKDEVHFYISAYEYEKLIEDEYYEIYYVFNLHSKQPKVYYLDSKMLREKFDEVAIPVTYRVDFTSKDIKN